MFRDALRIQQKFLRDDDPAIVSTLLLLARVMIWEKRLPEAEAGLRDVLARYRKETMEFDESVSQDQILWAPGNVLLQRRKLEEAEVCLRESVALQREMFKFNPSHQRISDTLRDLGTVLLGQTRWVDAEIILREVLARARTAAAAQPANVSCQESLARTLLRLGENSDRQGRQAEAEAEFLEAVAIHRRMKPSSANRLAASLLFLGRLLRAPSRWGEVEVVCRDGRKAEIENDPGPRAHGLAKNWVEALKQQGKTAEIEDAIAMLGDACREVRRVRRLEGSAEFAAEVIQAIIEHDRFALAEALARENLAEWEQRDSGGWQAAICRSLLGRALLGGKKLSAAEPILLLARDGLQRHKDRTPLGSGGNAWAFALRSMEILCLESGRVEQAAEWRRKRGEISAGVQP